MEVLLYTILTLCALGVFSAVILYFVARKFRVEEDPRIDEVEKMLPGRQLRRLRIRRMPRHGRRAREAATTFRRSSAPWAAATA